MSVRRAFTATAVAATAAGLLLSLSGSALAATGDFSYLYTRPGGDQLIGKLANPRSGECLTLPEAADLARPAAVSPRNDTASTVVMYTGLDCTGQYYVLNPKGKATARLELRSVYFS